MKPMNLTLKVLGALLTYPDETLQKAIPEFREVLESDDRLKAEHRPRLNTLLDYIRSTDPWELQESYVERFDTGRSTSLHLFEHVHGESKDRGQAMVDLKAQYEAVGLTLVPEELPDYLPAFLEFLSLQNRETASEFLGDCASILEALGDRLQERESPYAVIFSILLSFAEKSGKSDLPAVKPEKDLDAEWAEEPAFSSQGVC